jgi:hypothetical protein
VTKTGGCQCSNLMLDGAHVGLPHSKDHRYRRRCAPPRLQGRRSGKGMKLIDHTAQRQPHSDPRRHRPAGRCDAWPIKRIGMEPLLREGNTNAALVIMARQVPIQRPYPNR